MDGSQFRAGCTESSSEPEAVEWRAGLPISEFSTGEPPRNDTLVDVNCGGGAAQKHTKPLITLVPQSRGRLNRGASLEDLTKNLCIDAFSGHEFELELLPSPLEAAFALLAMQLHKGIPSRKLNSGSIGMFPIFLLHPSIHKLCTERQAAIGIPDDVG